MELRVSPRAAGWLLVAVAAVFAGLELFAVLGGGVVAGGDYLPLRHAAEALWGGRTVFEDPSFVYPPTAAVVLLPTAFGSLSFGFAAWVLAGFAALLFAAWLVAREAPARFRPAVLGVAVMGLAGGVIASRSLFLGNLSEFLVPLAVGILLAFHRGRWVLGCALLAASLLVKPLLVPLLLVPLLHRRWGALMRTMMPAGALLLLSMLVVPGGSHFPSVLRYCLTGTNLHGEHAIYNLSLRGWAEAKGVPHLIGVLAALTVVAAVATRVRGATPIRLGTALLFATFLAGSISEVHYLLSGYAAALLCLVAERAPVRVWAWFVPGLLLLALPGPYLQLILGYPNDGQSWLVGAELLILVALLATTRAEDRAVAPHALAPA